MKLEWPWTRRSRELDEELSAHFEMAKLDRVQRGENTGDAERNAHREFGNEMLVREVTRQMWGWTQWERIGQDIRYALRALRHAPGFAVGVVLCLALGIGANTAAFSVADALLLRPLAVPEPERVVMLSGSSPENQIQGISYPDFIDLREKATSLAGICGYHLSRLAVSRDKELVPRVKMGASVTADFFQTLGVAPVLGRAFEQAESAIPGRDAVVVLSHEFWRAEFAADPRIVGGSLRLNGVPFTIIGVAPRDFFVHTNLAPAFYVPITMTATLNTAVADSELYRREQRNLNVRARLKPGVSLSAAQSELSALAQSLASAHPLTNRDFSVHLRTEREQRITESPQLAILAALLVALSLLVLIIACANAANLVLARARVRGREMAVRLAIGAGRTRLIQQLLTESLVLSLIAGAAGVALALAVIRQLSAFQVPTDTPIVLATRLDTRALLFALAVSVLSAILAGLAPAWHSLSEDLAPAMKTGDTPLPGRGRLWGRNALVAGQVSLSLVLLVTSAALIDAFRKMSVADPGIRTNGIMTMEFDPALLQYGAAQSREFYRQLVQRAATIPGAARVGLTRGLPFKPNFADESVVPEGYQLPPAQRSVKVSSNVVDEGYFQTLGVEILRGRQFSREDTSSTRRVAIVNQEFAQRYWKGQDALGRRFRLAVDGPWLEVIGVARTGKYMSLAETPQPYFYLPYDQNQRSRMTLLVETRGEPAALTRPLLDVVRSLDANLPAYNVRDLQSYYVQGVLGTILIVVQIAAAIGAVGLCLAILGLYSLISYSVSRRTREIGIRMAVGAGQGEVLRMVLRSGLGIACAGCVVGLALSIPAFRVLSVGLAGVGALTPWTLVAAPVALLVIAAVACYAPALRASRIDPNRALRLE